MSNATLSNRLETVLNHPLHQHLGISTLHAENGDGQLSLTIGENAINPSGAFHGGVLYLLADVCAYCGLLSLLDEHQEAVTHDIQVSVLRSATLGDEVSFESQVLKLGKRIAFMEVKAMCSGKLIASAKVTKSLISTKA